MEPSVMVEGLLEKTTSWLKAAGEMTPNLILATLVLFGAWYAAKFVRSGVSKALERAKVNASASDLLAAMIRVAIVLGGVAIVLGILELDKALASVLAGAGVVGLALGFAFQDLAANLISGVGLAFNRAKPFKLGDLVETNGEVGRVKEIELRTSTIETLDGKVVVIPNKQIYQNKLINHSASGLRRVDIACGVSYGDDLEAAKTAALEAIGSIDGLSEQREPDVIFTDFGDSSVNFMARFWVDYDSEGEFRARKSEAICAIFAEFNNRGITIPFPIRTLDFGQVGGTQLKQQLDDANLRAVS